VYGESVHSSESDDAGGWRGEGVMNSVAGRDSWVGNEGVTWCKQRADLDPDGMGRIVGRGVGWLWRSGTG